MKTLPTDSAERKEVPLHRGLFRYFPAALAGVARISKAGNDKHNAGQEMHHARGKSSDHGDCLLRHLTDLDELLAEPEPRLEKLLEEASCLAWRALAWSQELHERFGAPLAPGAKLPLESSTGGDFSDQHLKSMTDRHFKNVAGMPYKFVWGSPVVPDEDL